MARLERWEGSEVASWERWEGSEVARREWWENNKVTRWKVPSFFQKWKTQSPRFHLFVFDVNQRNEVAGYVQDILS